MLPGLCASSNAFLQAVKELFSSGFTVELNSTTTDSLFLHKYSLVTVREYTPLDETRSDELGLSLNFESYFEVVSKEICQFPKLKYWQY